MPSKNLAIELLPSFSIALLLHLILIIGISLSKDDSIQSNIVKVALISKNLEKKQIVANDDAKPSPKAPLTPFLSDKNSKVQKETIKKGQGAKQKKIIKKSAKKKSKPLKKSSVNKKSPNLFLDKDLTKKLLESSHSNLKINKKIKENSFSNETQRQQSKNLNLTPGSLDFLPSIRDGEITLLNTKAHRFSVFVRRVATKVFGELRKNSWQHLTRSDIIKISNEVSFNLTMTKNGKPTKIELRTSSGSKPYDKALKKAIKNGGWDNNPPQSALSDDGNFHFIFSSKIWSRNSTNKPGESRWIVLSTGLL